MGVSAGPEIAYYRKWSGLEDPCFADLFSAEIVGSVAVDQSVDEMCLSIINSVNSAVDQVCPKIILKNLHRKTNCPWIDRELLNLIKDKNKLQSKYYSRPMTYGHDYRILRNRVNNSVESAKKSYFQNLITTCNNNSKKTWKILNNILNRNGNTHKFSSLISNGSVLTSIPDIACALNEHFTEAPLRISRSLPPIVI